MNKNILIVFIMMAFVAIGSQSAFAKSQSKGKMYMFGLAKNYLDSTTYMTEVIPVDSIVVDAKTGFLYGLELYTDQLNRFFISMGRQGYVCSTFYAPERGKLEKMMVKITKRIERDRATRLQRLSHDQFVYRYENPNTIYKSTLDASQPAEEESK